MYTTVAMRTENFKSIRLPIDGNRLAGWEAMLKARKISQQEAIYSLIDWVVTQTPIVQSMVLGQLTPEPGLIDYVLKSLPKSKKGAKFSNTGGKLPTSSSNHPG